MSCKSLITGLASLFILGYSLVQSTGCANIIPPSGGPRDSLPPVLVKVQPRDSTVNFSGNRVVFTFDEYIDLQNVQENLLVSPLPVVSPLVEHKLNTVTLRLRDSLEPNTTYTLNFGGAIKDYNEGNVMRGFSYHFSTGSYFDSLELRGNVIIAETGKIDTTLQVLLHTSPEDSAVVNQRPRYVARLDSKGNFEFKNLPAKTFYLYALKDEGGTRRYFSDKQLFAFATQPVEPATQSEPIQLYAYAAGQQAAARTTAPVTPMGRIKQGAGTEDRLRYQSNLVNKQHDLLQQLVITFDQPLRRFDSAKIKLYTDSSFIAATGYTFKMDSLQQQLSIAGEWKEGTLYHLVMQKDVAEDSLGKKLLKTDTLSFETRKLSDYGSLRLKLRNLDVSQNPVIQFIVNESIFAAFPLSSQELNRSLFPPGEYELRILYDNNKNGVWDPGDFFGTKRQPEIVKPIQRRIAVKPAWQNEFEIAL